MELPVAWIYGTMIGDYLVKAAMLIHRFRGGRWKTLINLADEDAQFARAAPAD